jgi:hypothetical protein
MNRRTLFCLPSLLLCSFAWNASAQTDTCSNYLVPLVVRNVQGERIRNLSANDLEVKLNGNILPVENIQRESRPRRIVILIDASGSMAANSTFVPWRQSLDSASLLAGLSEGRAHLALLIFSEKILEEISFSADNTPIVKRIAELQKDTDYAKRQVHGRTILVDAMNRALQMFGQPSSADALYRERRSGERQPYDG